jgi:putative transposase
VPWKETCAMDERMRFVVYYLEHEWPMAALCREFGISRKTGYKWIRRYVEEPAEGVREHSRVPHEHPHAVTSGMASAVVAARVAHPCWGPRKLRVWLSRQDSSVVWPAASTIGQILKRHGLVVSRHRRRKVYRYAEPFLGCDRANAVWSADLKGWFVTGDGSRCDPLTITDNYSRYLLRCQAVTPATHAAIKPVFEAAFREYGLPLAIRTDNGVPFATTTVGGLSRLSIWWLKLGIIPERIEPGQPAQNGRHERMHRTLKRETASPPQPTLRAQQRAFDRFCSEYNHQRPHEAIAMDTPASRYQCSNRSLPLRVPDMTYPDDMMVRTVHAQGDLRWRGRQIYLSETLAGERVGCRQVDDHLWEIYFAHLKLAQLDTSNYRLKHLAQPKLRNRHNHENED